MAFAPSSSPRRRTVGRYEIFDKVASGGMGSVYLGCLRSDAGLARAVAIKRLHRDVRDDSADGAKVLVDEARLSMRVRHPNVVSTLDVVQDGDELILVLDYVLGETLSRLCARASALGKRVPVAIACAIVHGVLLGLDAAHEAKDADGNALALVHRDVSPQNVMVGADGIARVLDFGIAKAEGRAQTTTREGRLKGKLGYMAPEQVDASTVDRRADLFAAGVVLWETLALERLFVGESAAEVIGAIACAEAPAITTRRADAPTALAEVITRALARRPQDRFATAADFAEALERAVSLASSREVAAWVREVAGGVLDERAAALAAVERGEPVPRESPAPMLESLTPSDAVAPRSEPEAQPTTKVPSATLGRRKKLVVALAAVAGGVVIASLLFARDHRTTHDAPSAASASSAASTIADPSGEPSTIAAPSAAQPSAFASASAGVAPPPAARSTAAHAPHVKPSAKPTRPDCRTPFVVDSRGIRVPRPECF